MKTSKLLFSIVAIAFLLSGCRNGKSTSRGQKTNREAFLQEFYKLPEYGNHPYLSASLEFEVKTKMDSEIETGNIDYTWGGSSWVYASGERYAYWVSYINGYIAQKFPVDTIDDLEKEGNLTFYIHPLSIQYESSRGTIIITCNSYGLVTYFYEAIRDMSTIDSLSFSISYSKKAISPSINSESNLKLIIK